MLSFALLSGAVDAQAASYTFFGQQHACQCSTGGETVILDANLPKLGVQFRVSSWMHPGSTNMFLLTGASWTRWGSLPLPFDPSFITCGGSCSWCGKLLVSPDVVLPVGPINNGFRGGCGGGGGPAEWDFHIPSNPALLGVSFYQQVLLIHSSGALRLSVGGHGVIGT